jgi:adenosylcobinamide-GDP ribazoletransferase
MDTLRRELRYAFTALAYFTRIPAPRWVGFEPHYLNAAARYFPLVGVLVGGVGAAVYLGAAQFWPPAIAAALGMAATLLLTGAFHEDGLADSVDAFGGGYTREDVLRIMHDSRIGAFGAIALVMALLLKWQVLVSLPLQQGAIAMIVGHAFSRLAAISFLLTLDYVRPEGKAKPVAQRMTWPAFAVACVFGLAPMAWLAPGLTLSTVFVVALLRFALGRYFVRRIGGYTGDCLGLAQQVFELAILLTVGAWISS